MYPKWMNKISIHLVRVSKAHQRTSYSLSYILTERPKVGRKTNLDLKVQSRRARAGRAWGEGEREFTEPA